MGVDPTVNAEKSLAQISLSVAQIVISLEYKIIFLPKMDWFTQGSTILVMSIVWEIACGQTASKIEGIW